MLSMFISFLIFPVSFSILGAMRTLEEEVVFSKTLTKVERRGGWSGSRTFTKVRLVAEGSAAAYEGKTNID